MANNRIYLRCNGCGKEFFLGKRFGGGFYYENYHKESGTLEKQLNKFYEEHESCGEETLEHFEIHYEFLPGTV